MSSHDQTTNTTPEAPIPTSTTINATLPTLTTSSPAPHPTLTGHQPTHWHANTLAIHADDPLRRVQDIAPPIHLSSTFHYPHNPDELFSVRERKAAAAANHSASTPNPIPDEDHVYSRETTHNTTRLETILASLLNGESVVYSSGLAALQAAYILLRPSRVAITAGYHGAHAVLALQTRLTGCKVITLDQAAEQIAEGDVIHVETPLNPTGEARDLEFYAAIAKRKKAWLVVDATFGPPGLQDPFLHGADVVMHSGTKYLGGHSDLLCGVLATRNKEWAKQLRLDRTAMGNVIGGLEAWLVVRSLRTLGVRVERASRNVAKIVGWLEGERVREGSEVGRVVKSVLHASLQPEAREEGSWLRRQMPNGWGPVFAVVMHDKEMAKKLPSLLRLFQHATSLGGVESLVEWRAMSDETVDEGLIRVSVGIEEWTDLQKDLEQGLKRLAGGA